MYYVLMQSFGLTCERRPGECLEQTKDKHDHCNLDHLLEPVVYSFTAAD